MDDEPVEASTVIPRRHPHQVFLAALMVVVGIPTLVGGPRPNSLAASLPSWLLYEWAITLTLGGLLVLGAAIVRKPINALYLECVAHIPLSLSALAYVVALLGVAGWRTGFSAACIVLGFGAASAWRARQVFADLFRLRQVLGQREDG